MIDMIAEQIPDLPRKAARKQAAATLATMMGALVLSRVAGNGEFSEDILAAGREAALDGAACGEGGGEKARQGGVRPALKRRVSRYPAKPLVE